MKLRLPIYALLSSLACGAAVMTSSGTASAWYMFENVTACALWPEARSDVYWHSQGGWWPDNPLSLFCPLHDSSTTRLHQNPGVWLYGYFIGGGGEVTARICTQYYWTLGGTCGALATTAGMPRPGAFEMGVDTSALLGNDGTAYIEVTVGKYAMFHSYWIQGSD